MSNRKPRFARGELSLLIRMRFASLVAFFCLLGILKPCLAQPSEVSYQGELKKDGLPFTGTAQMKFVLIDGAGVSIWSNDGTSASGSEPAAHIDVAATNGIFAIRLGASPMEPISGSLLKGVTEVALRVWVNTGDGFEQMTDQPISSSAFSLSGEKCLEIGDLQINVVPRWDGSALTPGSLFDDGTNVGVGTMAPSTKLDVAGTVRSSTGGFQFPDGTLQTTAVTGGGGGVPSGAMILTESPVAPEGYFAWRRLVASGTDRWRDRVQMSVARRAPGVSVLNDKLLVFGGGYWGNPPLSTVHQFDPVTNSWSVRAPMISARHDFATAVVDGRIYVFGGYTTGGVATGLVESYDSNLNIWSARSPMPTARGGHVAAVVAGNVVIFGGVNEGSILDSVHQYDPAGDSWSVLPVAPVGLQLPAIAVLDDRVYLFGGNINGAPRISSVRIFDYISGEWGSRSDMPIGRSDFVAASYAGRIFLFGGSTDSGVTSRVDIYDPVGDSWEWGTDMPHPSAGHAVGVIGNSCFLVGPDQYCGEFVFPNYYYGHIKK